jgi:hypothetical protein
MQISVISRVSLYSGFGQSINRKGIICSFVRYYDLFHHLYHPSPSGKTEAVIVLMPEHAARLFVCLFTKLTQALFSLLA